MTPELYMASWMELSHWNPANIATFFQLCEFVLIKWIKLSMRGWCWFILELYAMFIEHRVFLHNAKTWLWKTKWHESYIYCSMTANMLVSTLTSPEPSVLPPCTKLLCAAWCMKFSVRSDPGWLLSKHASSLADSVIPQNLYASYKNSWQKT